ncbi:arsenic resistance N-acetyltransferase ArsN2 [Natronomonas gomsonensis]|uniref:arsenic resistance N-acetyltransferase ArsN2 n=1 Tax=Natronomonas gomsonensis TaxID=1046043 RepID=UPI0015B9F36E|nr:arsenic resistance N-acetyltransferase ArsN2 [Natronomonas gomsonensis]
MDESGLRLRGADAEALEYVETLLTAADLPAEDVRSNPERFYVAFDGDDRVGIGGLEPAGDDALLRSVVVEAAVRGRGYGEALRAALGAKARADGVDTLYLLTTTAADFFAEGGYTKIDRKEAPDAVRETREFEEFCPSTAICMRKEL